MNTKDLFKINRQARRLNEGLEKLFGKKINLEDFDLHQLQDARNKLRTQVSQARSQSEFNENLENDAYHQARFMLDAINAEIAEREECFLDAGAAELDESNEQVDEKAPPGAKAERMVKHIKSGYAKDGKLSDKEKSIAYATAWKQHNKEKNEDIHAIEEDETVDDFLKRGGKIQYGKSQKGPRKPGLSMASRHIGGGGEKMKASRTGLGAKTQGSSVVGMTTRTAESIEEDNMKKLNESEINQASTIVTAKTMVDRVGRWIEELSGMENDTLLELGDSIRDEMGQEQSKQFISAVAPAIQQALDSLKTTRETIATSVRGLTGEVPMTPMLGAEGPEAGGDMDAAAPDVMNAPGGLDDLTAGDDFAAADAAAGGAEAAGREQRESIQFQNRLMRVLAG
jgi:hypothetical protein